MWPNLWGGLTFHYVIGIVCISTVYSGISSECECPRDLKPVCGTDGHTYSNECEFKCTQKIDMQLQLQYQGSCCPSATLCAPVYNPVCDENNVGYENECQFEFHKCVTKRKHNVLIKIKNRGKCMLSSSKEVTSRESKEDLPVIDMDTDGSTTTVKATTRCDFECPSEEDFVCDTNGITHANTCYFEKILCALREQGKPSIGIDHEGKCTEDEQKEEDDRFEEDKEVTKLSLDERSEEQAKKSTSAPALAFGTRVYEPSKHRSDQQLNPLPTPNSSYENLSSPQQNELKTPGATRSRAPLPASAALQPNSELNVQMDENCSAELCDKTWDPVCDSKNTTHRNECLFKFRVCKLKKSQVGYQFIPEIVKKGACEEKQTTISPKNRGNNSSCNLCEDKAAKTPVCDNTNHTHQSPCLLAQWNCKMRQHKLEERVLVHVGSCKSTSLTFSLEEEECPGQCSNQYKPVCDSQGMTHPNLCTFQMFNCRQRKQNLKNTSWLVSLFECPKTSTTRSSTTTTFTTTTTTVPPILMKEEKPHINLDAFVTQTVMTQNLSQNEFECPESSCPDTKEPLCDNEGIVHKNLCLFANARCLAARDGRTLFSVADEDCTANKCRIIELQNCSDQESDAICGSDFHTYDNECLFNQAQCQDNDLEVLFKGDCSQCLTKPCPLVDPTDPSVPDSELVCDQNGESKSLCEFDMIKCIYEVKLGHNITEAYTGRCCPTLDSCPSTNQPVCDTRNRQHRNLCHFKVAQCRASKIEKSETQLTLRNNGSCMGAAKQPLPPILPETTTRPSLPRTPPMAKSGAVGAGGSMDNGAPAFSPLSVAGRTSEAVKNTDIKIESNNNRFANPGLSGPAGPRGPQGPRGPVGLPGPTSARKAEKFGPPGMAPINVQLRRPSSTVDGNTEAGIPDVFHQPQVSNKCFFNCTEIYEPVCGSDTITYINKCHFDAKTCQNKERMTEPVTIQYDGPCCTTADCWDDLSPVCDNTGNTHLNLCAFSNQRCHQLRSKSANLTIASYGPCPSDKCDFDCPKLYRPVCGSNGETYVNECELRKLNCYKKASGTKKEITIDYPDECCEVKQCSEFYSPVCDSNGHTHVNKCVFEAEKCVGHRKNGTTLTLAYEGQCCSTTSCNDAEDPVCDGMQTHKNWCYFRSAQCEAEKKNETLSPLYTGVCCQRPSGACETSGAICDDEGETHDTRCDFEYKRCIMDKQKPRNRLTVAYSGKCCDPTDCPFESEPVCDSNGTTHQNPCFFQNVACEFNRRHPDKALLKLVYDGECCVDDCLDDVDPVCDDKGGVHRNECKFKVTQCEAKKRGTEDLTQTLCNNDQLKSAFVLRRSKV